MTLSKNKLSQLIVRKNERLVHAVQKNGKDSDKARTLKKELDRLIYRYYKSIGA